MIFSLQRMMMMMMVVLKLIINIQNVSELLNYRAMVEFLFVLIRVRREIWIKSNYNNFNTFDYYFFLRWTKQTFFFLLNSLKPKKTK